MQRDADNERNRIKISDLEINSKARRVTRDGQTLKLGALTYDLLLTLVDAAPGLVTYETLAERVWRGRAVTPETIAQRAKLLREALSDSARNPRYVELIRGKGYRLIPDPVALAEEPGQQSSVGIRFASVLAILVLVAACAWVYLAPPQEHRSVAVLPFDNLAAPGGPDPVGDAIATEIIVRLASLERLNVASRSESFQHRDPSLPARELGQTLGVSTLVEGSVQQLAGNLRITAQLVDARNGYTLWAAVFNRDKQDLFAVQQDIAESVASALGVKLGVGGVNDFMGAGTRSVEAYEAYLRGNLDGALALDPNYAAAWGGKAIRVASTMFNHLPHEAPEIIAEAQKLSARAVALDPNSAAAHANQATLTYPSMNWDAAEAAYHRSLELRRDVHNLSHYGNMLMRAGRSSAAIEIYNERDALLNRDDHQVPFRILAESALGNRERVAQQARQLGVSSKFYSAMAIALSSGDEATIR
ncbi:MAG: winged helix-turn-helix domain-containing protein, partial [Pseudomonadota bacterium]